MSKPVKNKKTYLTWLQYGLFLGAGIFLIYWQLKSMNAGQRAEFLEALQQANYYYLLPIVLMGLISHYIRALRWKLLMEPLDFYPKTKNVFSAVMVGYLANSAVPRLGEVLKCTILAKYEKLKVDKLLGTILVERTIDLICFIIFVILTIISQFNILTQFLNEQFNLLNTANNSSAIFKMIVVIVIILVLIFLLRLLFTNFPDAGITRWIRSFITGVSQGFLTVLRLKKKRQFFLLTIFMWALYLIQIYIAFFALDKMRGLGMGAACSVLTLVTLAIIITPGGIGTFPIFVMQVLLMYGVTKATGQAFGWMMWGVTTAVVVVTGLICLVLLPYFNMQTKNRISVE